MAIVWGVPNFRIFTVKLPGLTSADSHSTKFGSINVFRSCASGKLMEAGPSVQSKSLPPATVCLFCLQSRGSIHFRSRLQTDHWLGYPCLHVNEYGFPMFIGLVWIPICFQIAKSLVINSIWYINDLTRVVFSYEIYETSLLRRVS